MFSTASFIACLIEGILQLLRPRGATHSLPWFFQPRLQEHRKYRNYKVTGGIAPTGGRKPIGVNRKQSM
jgi:hypothetical protein